MTLFEQLPSLLSRLRLRPEDGLQIIGAANLRYDPQMPLLIANLADGATLARVKVALLGRYPPVHPMAVVHGDGLPLETSLGQLSDDMAGPDAWLYVPALPIEQDLGRFEALVWVVQRLRAPDGCPWDKEQTHESIKKYLLEECYEALEALDSGDMEELPIEMGDLMLQIVLHSQIAAEAGEFAIEDVLRAISTKLIRRHPHVFGSATAATSDDVWRRWDELKRAERADGASVLSTVPSHLPALAYSLAVQQRAARAGFAWIDIQGAEAKFAEEMREYREAASSQEALAEMGDVLFTLVNLARYRDIDPEEALRLANRRFYERFTGMEAVARERGLALDKLSLAQWLELWDEAKRRIS